MGIPRCINERSEYYGGHCIPMDTDDVCAACDYLFGDALERAETLDSGQSAAVVEPTDGCIII